ncbi:MAG: exo-beta-N-acetylmuramidase NamZ domain-containing protein [Cryomorphaceae bacterium]
MKIACCLIFIHASLALSCGVPQGNASAESDDVADSVSVSQPREVLPGVHEFFSDVAPFREKRIGVVANHTALIDGVHLIDTLVGAGLNVQRIFAPEHGFRGNVADGVTVKDDVDPGTGRSVVSLYGKNKKPRTEQLADLDLVIFDIQDVGARFYTFLSTLHYVMEACAEEGIPVHVLDRPNPNRHYVDGPVLEPRFTSFVGMHPVPAVYGMTIGEYAQMINGEGWLKGRAKCELHVVPCQNYSADTFYDLPVAPSPNLPDMASVYLYPSLCFFEGTTVSVGRGTTNPFAVIGEPTNSAGNFEFVPQPIPGVSDHPPHKGKKCLGYNLRDHIDLAAPPDSLNIGWLVQMYSETGDPSAFFLKSGFIDKLAGTDRLRKDVAAGKSAVEIRTSWQADLRAFEKVRAKYLIYSEE